MKRKKRKSKADIITGALYVIFGIMVLAVLYGLGSLVYALLGTTVGNNYYADLAEDMHTADSVNFTALAAKNPEVKAWVTLEDTAIDLPIVQTSDNSFYLTHRFDEKKNKLGTPFIDTGCAGDFSSRHTVIYGHAVRSGAMLGSLWEYENPNYFQRHQEMQLYLSDGSQYTLAVFACARVAGVRSEIPVSFSSDAEFLSMIDEYRELSAFTSAIQVGGTDRIVTFCVISPDSTDERLLVSCKIVDSTTVTTVSPEKPETVASPETPAETAAPEESPAA